MKKLICGICMFLVFPAAAQMKPPAAPPVLPDGKESVAAQEPDFWNVIMKRRSVRKYKPDSIPDSALLKIINAARMAPTSGNQQPWKFLVVRDKKKIDEMEEKCIERSLLRYDPANKQKITKEEYEKLIQASFDNYFSAPVYIVVLTDNNSMYPDYNHWDGPLAAGYLMLAARALGYGTVFITDAIPESVSKEVLQIPDRYTRVCITPVGIPVEWPAAPPKKNLEDFIVYDNF
ncbi:MAG: nitroreductase family protein [Bacteroidota bacterium]